MAEETTRQKIADVALDLFSKNGYTAVSIRDICGQVGIKESTVYYHFKNKRAIFEALLLRFETTAQNMMNRLDQAMADMSVIGPGAMQTVSDVFFDRYLMDDFCNQFMRVMSLEKFNDEEVCRLYTKWMFDEPLRFQSRVFAELIKAGIVSSTDSGYLAIRYYSPIYLYTQRYLLSGQLTEEKKKEFRAQVDIHVFKFFMECGVQ